MKLTGCLMTIIGPVMFLITFIIGAAVAHQSETLGAVIALFSTLGIAMVPLGMLVFFIAMCGTWWYHK